MDTKKIGLFIYTKRKEKKLTQKNIAELLFITDRAVSKWERGISIPDVSILPRLAEILDVTITDILSGEIKNIDNEDPLILGIGYGNKITKIKFKQLINKIAIVIFIAIFSIVGYLNAKIIYYNNYKFKNENMNNVSNEDITKIKNKIALIKENQGNFSDKEYEQIHKFIERSESFYNFEELIEMININKIGKKELKKIIEKYHLFYMYNEDRELISNIYQIIIVQNPEKIRSFNTYINLTYTISSSIDKVTNYLISLNTYKIQSDEYFGYNYGTILYYNLLRLEIVIDDIIEVGEIHA